MHKKREKIASYIISVLAITAFVLIAFYALVWANGLKIDFNNGTIVKTAMIAIEPTIKDATILLNGETVGSSTPLQERNLAAGRYSVVIKKVGYLDYNNVFTLATGQVGIVNSDVVLLASNPTIEKNIPSLFYHTMDPYDVGISISNGEIFDNGSLITRLSGTPSQVHRLNAGYVYQLGDQVRLYLPPNNQDVLVFSLPNDEQAKINLDYSNWQVIVFDKTGATTVIHLLEPSASTTS